jgi:hypothetical protein
MAGFEYTLKVTPQFTELLARLGPDIDRGFEFGMTNVVTDVEARAVKKAPVDTSNLVNSITSFVANNGRTGVVKATALYAQFVHDGTDPHVIRPKSKKALFWPGAASPFKKVNHPGTKPQPFITDALEEADIDALFNEGLQNFLRRRGW